MLVGAGPGSPDLITVRGLRALRVADVVIVDRLLPPTFLDGLGLSAAAVVWLGSCGPRRPQDAINRLMTDAARAGRTVVRLKCGDPFVFGRGREEIDALIAAGIPCEVVPGLTAAVAAPSNAGLPLTDRRDGRSFAAVSARRAGGGTGETFPRADSLVVFMGVAVLDEVAGRLLADGWPADTPAAIIERATQSWERSVAGTLDQIATRAAERSVRAPALLLVGSVAAKAGSRRTILYTGLDPANFRLLGRVIHWPALRVVADEDGRRALPDALAQLRQGAFGAVIVTSRVGARSFFAELNGAGLDARALAGATVTAAGAGTALALAEAGIRADVVPNDAGSRGILAGLGEVRCGVLVVQGTHAPAGLCDELGRRGADVTRLSLHRVEPNPDLGRPLPEHDVVYFASPSGVRAWHAAYGAVGFGADAWCMGDVTRRQLAGLGFNGKVVNPHVPEHAVAAAAAD
jgi:uroporphyrinogen III methyltransferase/synthase